jgi:DNA-binding NarL/FixJ family response regulator
MRFSIALTEDNSINRNTFMQKVSNFDDLDMVFSAVDGQNCLELLKNCQHLKLPNVIFMDLEMPKMDGIETIRIAKSLYPQIHFIVLTVFDDDEKIFEAIRAGATGYLLKHEPADIIHESIVNVINYGGAPMSPAIARKAMELLSRSTPDKTSGTSTIPKILTEREHEILQHMVKGWDAKRISIELDISVLTIRKHIANIYQKLHVNSKAQIISLAHKNNWL